MTSSDDLDLLSPRDSGRILALTTSGVIKLERTGKLRGLRDSAGRRFFRRSDVERLAAARSAARERGAADAVA